MAKSISGIAGAIKGRGIDALINFCMHSRTEAISNMLGDVFREDQKRQAESIKEQLTWLRGQIDDAIEALDSAAEKDVLGSIKNEK